MEQQIENQMNQTKDSQKEIKSTNNKQINRKQIEAAIEAILFTMGESVELEKIAAAIECDKETTKSIIYAMMERYQEENRGIKICELENSFQFCTKQEMYEYLIRVAAQPKRHIMTEVLLETLSIIAYKQPITRGEIEKIRGVKCDHAVSKLMEYGLIADVGRLDAPGRPLLFGTTEEFLRQFGVASLSDLPVMNAVKQAELKLEAEEEIPIKMKV